MKNETAALTARQEKYRLYLKRHYASLRREQRRGGFIPDYEQFIEELRNLTAMNCDDGHPMVANG